MITSDQFNRLRRLVQILSRALPEPRALDALVLLFDVLEILELSQEQMQALFGPAALRYITELVYGSPASQAEPQPEPRPAEPPVLVPMRLADVLALADGLGRPTTAMGEGCHERPAGPDRAQ